MLGGLRFEVRLRVTKRAVANSRLTALEDVYDAHAAATYHVAQSSSCAMDLTLPSLTAQLQGGFPDLSESCRAAGMPSTDQATVSRERDATAQACGVLGDEFVPFAVGADTQQFVVQQFFDRERVVNLDQVQVLRANSGLFVSDRCRRRRHLRGTDDRPDKEMVRRVALALHGGCFDEHRWSVRVQASRHLDCSDNDGSCPLSDCG